MVFIITRRRHVFFGLSCYSINNRIKIYYGLIYYQRKCEERREENISVVSGILIDLPEIPCFCTTLKVYTYCSINDRQPKVIYQSFDGTIF